MSIHSLALVLRVDARPKAICDQNGCIEGIGGPSDYRPHRWKQERDKWNALASSVRCLLRLTSRGRVVLLL